jgi:hypothetical protein
MRNDTMSSFAPLNAVRLAAGAGLVVVVVRVGDAFAP